MMDSAETEPPAEALVVGCGVIGLTVAVRLLERGLPTTIIARDLPPHTTSNVAAAVWYPYRAFPADRVLDWSRRSYEVYAGLAADPQTGVAMTRFVDLFDAPEPDPWWRPAVPRFYRLPPDTLPPGYTDSHVADVPLIETPVFMRYLLDRFQALGGRLEQRALADLAEVVRPGRVVFNCAGLGARELAADPGVYPIRGQIARVSRTPAMDGALFDESGHLALAYVIPRSGDCILGGTAEAGNWSLEVDPATAATIFDKCRRLVPDLDQAEVYQHLVGLRPGRAAVRLEVERLNGGTVVHNYGHGGAGFTLAWGCAEEAAKLALDPPRDRTRIR